MSMKESSDTIGNRTRDLPACSAVPPPTAPPRAPFDDDVDDNDHHHHHHRHHRHEFGRIRYSDSVLESPRVLWQFRYHFVALRLLSDPKEIPFVLRLSVSILSTRLLSVVLVCLHTFNLFMTVLWSQDSLASLIVWIIWVVFGRHAMTLDTTQQSRFIFCALHHWASSRNNENCIFHAQYNGTVFTQHPSYTLCVQFNSIMLLNLVAVL